MRTHYCRIKIVEGAGEKCDVSPDTISDLKKVLEFVEKHSDLQGLATRPIKALMSIPDPEIQEKAILHVEKTLNRKTPTGGKYKKRLTEPEVDNIIKKVSPPVPEPEKPKPVNNAGNHQPGDLVESGLPPQVSLFAREKAKEPEVDANGFFVTTPAKSQAQIRKENLALLEESCDLMLSRMPSARYVTIIELAMSEFPGEFPTKSQVISAALDLFNARKK
jgi:hypothetical protein